MNIDPIFFFIILGAGVAGFVQGLSGFAFGMIAMSFWAWVIEPQLAAVMTVFGALLGQLLAAFSVRRGFNVKILLPFIVGGLLGVPIGANILPYLNVNLFKTILGTLLVIWCPIMLIKNKLPRINMKRRFMDGFIGGIGGAMSGLGGFAGVIPTLWCTLQGFEKEAQRAIIQNFNLTILIVTMMVYIKNGIVTHEMLPLFYMITPAIIISVFIGIRLYTTISEQLFRKIVLTLLTISGVVLLSSSVFHC